MKILVPVKQVIDPYVTVRVKEDGSGIVEENMPRTMNPFDEIALQEAVMQRAALPGRISEILAVSIGPQRMEEVLRTALAMGADRVIHVLADKPLQSLAIAKILRQIVEEEKADLVLTGKQAVDSDNGQVGPMLAGLLDWPQACNASQLLLDPQQVPEDGFGSVGPGAARIILEKQQGEADNIIVICEDEDGLTGKALTLPALVTCDLRLNTPAPLGLAQVMKARRQPIDTRNISEFSVDPMVEPTIVKTHPPASRPACQIFDGAAELATRLMQEGLI